MKKFTNTIKKSISVMALSFVMVTAVTPITQVDAATKSCSKSNCDFTSGKLCYDITSSNTAACTGLSSKCSNATSVTVPSTVTCNGKTYRVTKVADSAFENNDCLKSVKVSNSVKSIGKNCFSGCDSLKRVSLGNCVNSLGSNAFESCSNLKAVNCSSDIKVQGSNCFGNATCKMS